MRALEILTGSRHDKSQFPHERNEFMRYDLFFLGVRSFDLPYCRFKVSGRVTIRDMGVDPPGLGAEGLQNVQPSA